MKKLIAVIFLVIPISLWANINSDLIEAAKEGVVTKVEDLIYLE